MNRWVILGLLAAGCTAVCAPAAFQPGHIYVTATYLTGFRAPGRIFEINPTTGASRIFAEFEYQESPNSLVFTPDGSRLRVVRQGSVFELDGDGRMLGPVYGPGVGPYPYFPSGSANAMAYDRAGNFYLGDQARGILRFPADTSPAEWFADVPGTGMSGPFAVSPDGKHTWYLDNDLYRLFHINEQGKLTLMDDGFLLPLRSTIAVDDEGNCYITRASRGGIYRYTPDKPSDGAFLSTGIGGGTLDSMTYNTRDGMIYLASGNIVSRIDPLSGFTELVAEFGVFPSMPARGVAIYVPEPAYLSMAPLVVLFCRRARMA